MPPRTNPAYNKIVPLGFSPANIKKPMKNITVMISPNIKEGFLMLFILRAFLLQ
jgi:hypothetical protein